MTQRSRTYLKGRFENGDIPNATDYGDLIDSFMALEASATETTNGSITIAGNITASGGTFSADVSANELYLTGHIHFGYSEVSALGTTQGSAVTYDTDVTLVKITDAQERGVVGGHFRAGINQKVINDLSSVTAAYVYPPSGTTFIDPAVTTAENAPLLVAPGGTMELIHVNTSSIAYVRY